MGGEEGPTKPDPRPLEACATIGKAACCDHPESAERSLFDSENPACTANPCQVPAEHPQQLGALDAEHRGRAPRKTSAQTSAVAAVRAAPATALAAYRDATCQADVIR